MKTLAEKLAAASEEDRTGFLNDFARHLAESGDLPRLRDLLSRFDFLRLKVAEGGIRSLIADYRPLRGEDDFERISDALRLAAAALDGHGSELASQLHARLHGSPLPHVRCLLEKARPESPWLRPMVPGLTAPGGVLEMSIDTGEGSLRSVAVDPEGSWIVVASASTTLSVWDPMTGERVGSLAGHEAPAVAVAFSQDGARVVSRDEKGNRKVWEVETGREVDEAVAVDRFRVCGEVRASEGELCITARREEILVRNVVSGHVCTLIGHFREVRDLLVLPGGKRLVSASGGDPGHHRIKVWDLDVGTAPRLGSARSTLKGHRDSIHALAVTPDGRLLLSASRDLKVWDLETGREVATLEGHEGVVRDVAIFGEGAKAATVGDDGTLRIWRLRELEAAALRPPHAARVTSVALSPYGRYALSGSLDRTLKLWDLAAEKEHGVLGEKGDAVLQVAFSPEGFHAVSASASREVSVWELKDGDPGDEHPIRSFGGYEVKGAQATGLRFTEDGGYGLALFEEPGRSNTQAILWSYHSGAEVASLRAPGSLEAVTVAPGARLALGLLADGRIILWDLATRKPLRLLEANGAKSLSLAAGESLAFAGGDDGTIRIWSLPDGRPAGVLDGHEGGVTTLSLDAACARLVAASDRTIRLWDLATRQVLGTFTVDARLRSCALSRDGLTVAAGDDGGRVHLLRLENAVSTAPPAARRRPRRPRGIQFLSILYEQRKEARERGARWHERFRRWYLTPEHFPDREEEWPEGLRKWLADVLLLEVPGRQMPEARKLGAVRYRELKKWGVPPSLDANRFKEWIPWLARKTHPAPRGRRRRWDPEPEMDFPYEPIPEGLGPLELADLVYLRLLADSKGTAELWDPDDAARRGLRSSEMPVALFAWLDGPPGWAYRAAEALNSRLPRGVFFFEPWDDQILDLNVLERDAAPPGLAASAGSARSIDPIENVTILAVPRPEFHLAARKGARWDPRIQRWYVPAGLDPDPFSDWIFHALPCDWELREVLDRHYFERLRLALATDTLTDPGEDARSRADVVFRAVLEPADRVLAETAGGEPDRDTEDARTRKAALETVTSAFYRRPDDCMKALGPHPKRLRPDGLGNLRERDVEALWTRELPGLRVFDDEEEGPEERWLDSFLHGLEERAAKASPRSRAKTGRRERPRSHSAPREVLLDDQELWEIPRSLLESPEGVRVLSLRNNSLAEIPPEISRFRDLQELRLGGNRVEFLPEELFELTSLRVLELDDNDYLTFLSPRIGALRRLETLRLDGNRLFELPAELFQLDRLAELDLAGNRLRRIPPEIGRLRRLVRLDLSENPIRRLPNEIRELTRLRELFLPELDPAEPIPDLTHIPKLAIER